MYNKVIMIGRLVADPELKTTKTGISVMSARIAVNRAYAKEGDKKSDFFNVSAWRQTAEFVCKYFAKGKLIGIEGSLQTRDFTDKEGNKRIAFEIVAEKAFFTEAKGSGVASPDVAVSGASDGFTAIDDDDDLPF